MKNLLASWFRNLTAFESGPVKQEFSIVDPTAASADGGLNTVILAVDPSDGNSPTIVSLYFDGSGVKLFEKKYQDDNDAQTEMQAMATDLNEAATLSKENKIEEAKKLAESLFDKYKRSSDVLNNVQPTMTMTQSAQKSNLDYKGFQLTQEGSGHWNGILTDRIAVRADSVEAVKIKIDKMFHKAAGKTLKKQAGIILQNVFFDTPDEVMEYQEKMKSLQGPESGDGKPLWEQMSGEDQVAPSNESKVDEDNELAPPSLSFDRIEKDKAKTDKDIGKRIKEQVKTEVESALEQKSASVFGKDQEDLVDALRKNGRNWDEIKKIFVKELSYNEDDTTVFLDSIRQKEEGGIPEGLPLPPKPPKDLVSPETHEKLIQEIDEKSEPKIDLKPEPKPLEDEIARADNAEIRKVAGATVGWDIYLNGKKIDEVFYVPSTTAEEVKKGLVDHDNYDPGITVKRASLDKQALNPLQEPPAIGQTPGQSLAAPVEEAPTFDSPVPPSQDSNPEPEFLEAPQAGDRVYVMGDYETGQDGFEGTMVSDYTSRGDEYAVISKDDGENAEVALHRVVKASQKKVAKAYYEKKASTWLVKYQDHLGNRKHDEIFRNVTEEEARERASHTSKYFTIKQVRDNFEASKKCPKCGEDVWDTSTVDQRLNKCWNCKTRFDNPEQEVEADLEVEGNGNEDVIRMFIGNSFPKDKMPVWGTANLKITKYPNGWALVNYQTPILYRADGSDVVIFNTKKYSVTTTKIQSQIRRNFAGQSVKETDEAGIHAAIEQSPVNENPELQSLHESALKIKAELECEGEIAIYFHKEGIEKQASGDSAFESNGWCRVWIQDTEIEANAKYPEILKLQDEKARIDALKDLARELAHEALMSAEHSANKVGVQSWFEGLTPSDHDRIDWAALASPKTSEEEDLEFEREQLRKYGPEAVSPEFRDQIIPKSSQDPKIEKKAVAILPESVKQEVINMKPGMNDAGNTAYHFSHDGHQVYRGQWVPSFLKEDFGPYQWAYDMTTGDFWDNPNYTPTAFASLKQAADPLLGPNGEPLPAKPETPTTLKQWQKAPKDTDKEKALPATMEQAQIVKEVESSLSSLEAIKSLVTQAKAKLAEEVRIIEEKGGRAQLEGEVKEKVERLSKLVQATQNQMIAAGDTLVRLVQETKEHPFKPSEKWKVEKLLERLSKYEDAAKYLKQAEDGAQHLATSEDVRELYFFPRKLSRLHKSAGFMETLDSVYNSVMEALKLIIGNTQEESTAV